MIFPTNTNIYTVSTIFYSVEPRILKVRGLDVASFDSKYDMSNYKPNLILTYSQTDKQETRFRDEYYCK